MAKRSWSDFTPQQRAAISAVGAAELLFKMLALRDISRRDADQIRGSKRLWRAAQLVNTLGPLSYFLIGRRNSPIPADSSSS